MKILSKVVLSVERGTFAAHNSIYNTLHGMVYLLHDQPRVDTPGRGRTVRLIMDSLYLSL